MLGKHTMRKNKTFRFVDSKNVYIRSRIYLTRASQAKKVKMKRSLNRLFYLFFAILFQSTCFHSTVYAEVPLEDKEQSTKIDRASKVDAKTEGIKIVDSKKEDIKTESTEVMKIFGDRNQANSEMTEQTTKLMSVAGIANDPLSSVFSLPGVVFAGGDDGEPAIRGSSPDDNAFYIDNMPVDYIFHLFGDSIFNANVVSDFKLHPASFGSEYGNATGGIFDIKLRDPRNQEFTTVIDANMLKSGIFFEGGITEDQAFYFSYRRSLIHLFLTEGEEEDGETITKSPISDDYQGKYQWLIGDQHKLTFNINGASDVGALNISSTSEQARVDPDSVGDLKLKTQFDQQGVSWQYFGKDQSTFHLSASHMIEKNNQSFGQGQFVELKTQRNNLRLLYQFDWLNSHKLNIGADFEQSTSDYSFDMIPFFCTDHDADCESTRGERIQDIDNLKNTNTAVYFNDIWSLYKDVSIEIGLRGEHNSYTGQSFIHPRFSLNWFPTRELKFKAKVGTYSRFPNIETALKKLGNPNINSPKASHYSLGLEYRMSDFWNTSLDVYYKDLGDMALALNDAQPNANLHYSNDLSGTAKGIEWVINRDLNNGWYGWASLSWSKSDRTDDLTNITTEYYLDTPLLANVVANYEFNDLWDMGFRFTARSGAKYTPITGLRENPNHDGFFLPNYGELNSKTLPTYTRLDIQANYKTAIFGKEAVWTFAIINALGSENISGYNYESDGNETINNFTIIGEKGMEAFPYVGLKVRF